MAHSRWYAQAGLWVLLVLSAASRSGAQTSHQDYDEVDPWLGFVPRSSPADSAAVASFLSDLAATRPAVCQLSVRSFGNRWDHGNPGDRIGILADESAQLGAHESLSQPITEPAAIALLAESLGHQQPCIRRAAARLLGHSQAVDAVRQLRSALRDREPRVREAAALGLAHAEDAGSLRDLTTALKDPDIIVIRMAAYALGELEDARAVKPLGEVLRSKDADTRITAAWALGSIEDIRSVDRLKPLVRDSDPRVRLAAVEALGEIEDYRATGSLADALKDKDVGV
ncbi:MAG TPA: HEAT repeat domain-containing protein, partial [Gemmatimonadales bacterium]